MSAVRWLARVMMVDGNKDRMDFGLFAIVEEISYIVSSVFFFSSRRRHTRCSRDWSSDVCSSDLFRRADPARAARGEIQEARDGWDQRRPGRARARVPLQKRKDKTRLCVDQAGRSGSQNHARRRGNQGGVREKQIEVPGAGTARGEIGRAHV